MSLCILFVTCVLLATTNGYTNKTAKGSIYTFHKNRLSWSEANATCAGEGAHLVVINDAEELNTVWSVVTDAVNYYATWTGLRDNRPKGIVNWHTVHGEPLSDVFHEWYEGRPINDTGRTCALFSAKHKKLYDVPCHFEYYFTCEKLQ